MIYHRITFYVSHLNERHDINSSYSSPCWFQFYTEVTLT